MILSDMRLFYRFLLQFCSSWQNIKRIRRPNSHTTCSPTPAAAAHFTSSHATVTVFVTVWPWPLAFWFAGQCIPSNCHRVHVYQVRCW